MHTCATGDPGSRVIRGCELSTSCSDPCLDAPPAQPVLLSSNLWFHLHVSQNPLLVPQRRASDLVQDRIRETRTFLPRFYLLFSAWSFPRGRWLRPQPPGGERALGHSASSAPSAAPRRRQWRSSLGSGPVGREAGLTAALSGRGSV